MVRKKNNEKRKGEAAGEEKGTPDDRMCRCDQIMWKSYPGALYKMQSCFFSSPSQALLLPLLCY